MSNDKTYFSETVRRAARPRSRRRREQGTGGAVRGYSGGGTTSVAPAPTGHSHTNKELLDSLRTDELNYLYKARVTAGGTEEGRDKVRAGQADTARDLTPDSPAYNRFLRKDADDTAAGVVDFLKGLRLAGKALTGILTTGDTAGADEANVLSALRTLSTFLRKDRPDTMPHLLKLLDGLETGTFAAGRTGGRIDRAGNGELGSLTLRDLLTAVRLITGDVRSKNYTPGDMGTGFGLTTGEGGSRLEVDYLLVRRVATFLELLIREMRHVGGTLVLSGASGKVVRVEDKPSAWRVHFKTREDGTTVAHGFTVGAQARCQTYNRTSGNTYYWRLVTATGDDWVELSKSDYDHAAPTGTARTAPAVGDELVQLGHRTDASRQGAIVLDTVGEGAPSIRLLTGIRSYSLTDANVRVLLSPSAVRVIADEVSFASGKSVEETITDSGKKAIEEAKKYFDTQKKGIDNSIGAVSGKVDNLVIGGRNLLKYARLIFSPETYAYGRGSYTTAVDTATLCEGQRSLKVTASKVGSVGGTDNFVWEAWNVVRQSECVTVSFYAKAATAGTRFSVRMGGDVCDFPQTVSLSTDWQRFEMTFRESGRKWMCIVAWFDRPDTVWIALPKMELGSRATDWSLAPEDVYNEAQLKANGVKAELNSSITDAKNAAQNVQTNLDNLTIGGRNLLRYSALEKTPLNNMVYGRKPENAPVGVEEGYQGAKAVKLVFTTPGKPSVNEVMWRTWEERQAYNRVEPVVLRFWAKADKDNTRMWTVLGYHGGKIARPTISSEWKEYTVNFMPDGPWALWCIGLDAPGTVWISRPKLEYGTKPTDWTPAPEDVDNSIAGVRNTANQASNDAGDAKQKAGEAATSAKIAETKAGEAAGSAKNAATSAGTAATKANEAAGSASEAKTQAANAAGSAQTAATNAAKAKADADAAAQSANASKEAADAAKTRLDSWAADNVISPMEKQGLRDETARIDADKSQVAAGYAKYGLGSYQSFTDAYNAYRAVLVTLSSTKQETIAIPADFATKQRNYYTQRSTALTRIADAAKEYVDGLQIGGRNLVPGTSNDWKQYQLRSVTNLTIGMGDILTPGLMEGEYISMSMDIHWKGITVQGTPGAVTQSEGNVSGWFKGQLNHNFTNLITSNPNEGYARLTHVWKMTKDLAENEFFKYGFRFDNMSGMFEYRRLMVVRGQKPMDWQPAPEDITSEIAAKTEAARQAAQAEAIGLNKWIAQAYYTGENNSATPPKLEDIAGKTPTRTVELIDAQFNVPGGSGSVFGIDYYTGIRTTYVYLDADYNLTTGIQHDDAGSLYVNGALVASGPLQTASWKSVTLPLKRGWNRIDGLWNEGGGGDYFKFQAPLENDAHIIQLACRPNVNIDPMRAVTMQSVEEQKAGFNTFNKQFTAWSRSTETTLTEYNNELTKLTQRVTQAELNLTHDKIWMGIKDDVTNTVNDKKTTLVSDLKSRTGIDIQQGVITLDAQKVKIQNGSQTMAMFEGGKLKADLIDASRIDAGKLNASQIFSGTIDARNATFNNLTVSQGSKLGGWKVQGSDLVSDAATNASIRIEHRGKLLTSDESNPIEINNSAGNTLLIDGSRSSVQAEVTLTGKINNIRALSELSPAGLYTNLAAQEYKYGSLGAVVANVMYMPSSRTFRTAGVVGRIHDSAPNRNASYKKGFNGVFGENLRADGLMLGARDLTGDGTVYSIESLMTDTVLLIRGRPIIDLSNTPAELKGKFFFIFTHTGTQVRFKKDGRITQDNNAWNIFLLFNGSTWEVRSWDCDYREF